MMTTTETRTPSSIERVIQRVESDPAALAALRRGVGRSLDDSPGSWPYVAEIAGPKHWREPAAHLAIGLFALHHQSQALGSMNKEGWSLGKACRALAFRRDRSGASKEGVERRFKAALAAEAPEALGVHLRGLVTLLRGEDVPLDYVRLYHDLCSWHFPDSRRRVCLTWARDYFATKSDDNDKENDQ